MELTKSADDTVRYSITAFCHVRMSFIHKGDFGFEVCRGLGGGGWPGRCARPGFGSLVQSLLPKDTLLGAFLKPLKFEADKECSNVLPKLFLHLVGTHKYSLSKTIQSSRLNK